MLTDEKIPDLTNRKGDGTAGKRARGLREEHRGRLFAAIKEGPDKRGREPWLERVKDKTADFESAVERETTYKLGKRIKKWGEELMNLGEELINWGEELMESASIKRRNGMIPSQMSLEELIMRAFDHHERAPLTEIQRRAVVAGMSTADYLLNHPNPVRDWLEEMRASGYLEHCSVKVPARGRDFVMKLSLNTATPEAIMKYGPKLVDDYYAYREKKGLGESFMPGELRDRMIRVKDADPATREAFRKNPAGTKTLKE